MFALGESAAQKHIFHILNFYARSLDQAFHHRSSKIIGGDVKPQSDSGSDVDLGSESALVRSGSDVLKTYDFNQDNKFADSELGTEFVLAISLGRPEFRRACNAPC